MEYGYIAHAIYVEIFLIIKRSRYSVLIFFLNIYYYTVVTKSVLFICIISVS